MARRPAARQPAAALGQAAALTRSNVPLTCRARAGDLLEQAGRLAEGLRAALRAAGDASAAAAPPPAAAAPPDASPPAKQRRTDGSGDGTLAAGARVGVMAPPGPEYVAAMWSAWLTGSVAVPLALSHPPAELSYVLRDAGITVVMTTDEFADVLGPLASECGAQLLRVANMTPRQVRGLGVRMCAGCHCALRVAARQGLGDRMFRVESAHHHTLAAALVTLACARTCGVPCAPGSVPHNNLACCPPPRRPPYAPRTNAAAPSPRRSRAPPPRRRPPAWLPMSLTRPWAR
jgi:hypothetical protein